MLVRQYIQQSIVFRRDMRGAALDAVYVGDGRQWIFHYQLTGGVSNAKGITVITDHIDQRSQFNAVNIHSDPARIQGQNVDGIGFHCEG